MYYCKITRHNLAATASKLLFACIFLCISSFGSPQEQQKSVSSKVRLHLKWFHQFQFAGYYAAMEKGYYRDAGLDVEIVEGNPGTDSVQEVVSGRADFGVGTSELIVRRARGESLVALATVFQHSATVLLARKDHGISNIHDLVGKTIMVEAQSADIFAYMKSEGICVNAVKIVPHSGNIKDLISGKVDAMTVYVTDELYEAQQAGVPAIIRVSFRFATKFV